jgi:hypothetical protein
MRRKVTKNDVVKCDQSPAQANVQGLETSHEVNKVGGPVNNVKAQTHGMHTLAQRGEAALNTPGKRSRYAELKELFESEPGRLDYRKELAALLAQICENGFDRLRVDTEAGKDVWTTPGPLKSLAVYVNSLTRLLDSWPKEGHTVTAAHVLDAIQKAKEAKDDANK